jgi:hypothetical protein
MKLSHNLDGTLNKRRIQSNYTIKGVTVFTDTRYSPDRQEFPYDSAFIIRNEDGSTWEGVAPLPSKTLEDAERAVLDLAVLHLQKEGL